MNNNKYKRKKNILFCENNQDGTIGGSYYSLLFLVKGLDKDKFTPFVIFYSSHILIDDFIKTGAKVYILNKLKPVVFSQAYHSIVNLLLKIVYKIFNFFYCFLIPSLRYFIFLKKHKISIVHLNNSILFNQDWMLAAIMLDIPCITHERGINQSYSLSAKMFAKKLKAIICISKAVRRNMIDKGINPNNLKVIYNGLDPSSIQVVEDKSTIISKLEISHLSPLVGIIGNIKDWKGQDVVIKATALVKKKYPDVGCLIIGAVSKSDQYYFSKLHDLVNRLNLNKNVLFVGFQKNIADFLNSLDIVIHASILPEPFGRVILEAMASRKPIIATKIGAPPEIIENGKTGLLVAANNEIELSEAICKLWKNKDLIPKMVNSAYHRLIEKFSLRLNLQNTVQLYRKYLTLN